MSSNASASPAPESRVFTPEQQMIIQALSGDEYEWRTAERLLAVTGLRNEALSAALTQLLREDVVKPSFSKKHNLIFGLRERVEKK